MSFSTVRALSALVVLSVSACDRPIEHASAPIGEPVPGLTAAELVRFRAGAALFNRVFTPEEGLGPLFNENQCSSCHTDPAAGGTGEQILVRATRFEPPDRCDALSAMSGENIRTRATPLLQAHGIQRQMLPASASHTARFTVSFLFGLGLVELIPEQTILALADPDDVDGDGISGRPGRDPSGRLGRFGRKADHATLRDFIETALRFEMGLTTPAHPAEVMPVTDSFPADVDPAGDPEVSDSAIAALYDFVRFLAPPQRRTRETAEERAIVAEGEAIFGAIGCTSCHVPEMVTGSSDVAALDGKRIELFSDLLLHDLGPGLVNACGIAATPTELRTAPLMGVSYRRALLHDGRTTDLTEAILLHGGEAEAVRERFRDLHPVDQDKLIQFLRTL